MPEGKRRLLRLPVHVFVWSVLTGTLLSSPAIADDELPAKGPDGPEAVKVYLSEEEALTKAFPEADTVWAEVWRPTAAERRRVERRLGWRLSDSTFTVYRGLRDGASQGFATVGEEVGLYRPITFMVKASEKGRVEAVWVMVYRESRGGEVRRKRFLNQYKGKHVRSPIRINRDIIGVTGATLSVRALNAGVKKALAIIEAGFIDRKGD